MLLVKLELFSDKYSLTVTNSFFNVFKSFVGDIELAVFSLGKDKVELLLLFKLSISFFY